MMSVANEDIPAPTIMPGNTNIRYPIHRTHDKFVVEECSHKFVFHKLLQTRRGDEAMSRYDICELCGFIQLSD